MLRKRLGVVVEGTFNAGLTARLDPGSSTEDLRIGDFVTIEGERNLYFSMISDIALRSTSPDLVASPPGGMSSFVAETLSGTNTYATLLGKTLKD